MPASQEQNRTQIRFQPTLFLYLGTSSGQIGYRLKQLLNQAYGDVPILRHLWVDIDVSIDPLAQPVFTDAERIELSGMDPAAVIQHIDNHPTIKAWWPDTTRLAAGMLAGGGSPQQMRLIGRLALFRMFSDRQRGTALITRLRRATQALFEIQNITAVHDKSTSDVNYSVEAGCRVVLVHSTSGGTGSSMSFDFAYLCRHLLEGKGPEIVSYSILPPVIDEAILDGTTYQKEKVRANTYAWFKEDNYLMENPSWNVQYPEGPPIKVAAPPFDYHFVIDIENQAGYRLNSPQDVYSMIAQAVFLDTGSSIAGSMRSFRTNVAALRNTFQGKRCAYSSLAAASLVFPKERLLDYCASRLGSELLLDGVLAMPDAKTVTTSTASLIQRLGLQDADLIHDLQNGVAIRMDLEPAIKNSGEVAIAVTRVDSQENDNATSRGEAKETIAKNCEARTDTLLAELDEALAHIAATRGITFALHVCDRLLESAPTGRTESSIPCLNGLKKRMQEHARSEEDLETAKDEFTQKRKSLRKLDDGPEDKLEQVFAPKGWKKKFLLFKNDTISAMRKVNDITLEVATVQQAMGVYDQLAEEVATIASRLKGMANAATTAARELADQAARSETATPAQTKKYEFRHEVDLDFDAYYDDYTADVNPAAISPDVVPSTQTASTEALANWVGDHISNAAVNVARHAFQSDLENLSLLSAIKELAEKHGERPQDLLEEYLDTIVNYCHPFWVYNPNLGLPATEGKSILGVANEQSPLIPDKYRNSALYEVKGTRVPDRIDIMRTQHGLPAFMIRGMDEYKAVYERKRQGIDPLHVLPDMDAAPDVMPEVGKENREWFAIGLLFDYIVQLGSWYYYDPDRAYLTHKVQPGARFRLAQGRENAEDEFAGQDAWVQHIEDAVEAEIRDMGNAAAISKLEEAISDHLQAISKMPTNDTSLRRQYEKEMQAFKAMQRRLGKIG